MNLACACRNHSYSIAFHKSLEGDASWRLQTPRKKRIVCSKLTRPDVALCSIDWLLNSRVGPLWHDTSQRDAVIIGRPSFSVFCFAFRMTFASFVQSTHGGLNIEVFLSSIALSSFPCLNMVCT